MTRKHYILLARALLSTRPKKDITMIQWKRDILAIANELKTDNPAFNYNRFFTACGIVKLNSLPKE